MAAGHRTMAIGRLFLWHSVEHVSDCRLHMGRYTCRYSGLYEWKWRSLDIRDHVWTMDDRVPVGRMLADDLAAFDRTIL